MNLESAPLISKIKYFDIRLKEVDVIFCSYLPA